MDRLFRPLPGFLILAGVLALFYVLCLFNRLTAVLDFDVNLVLSVVASLAGAWFAAGRTWARSPDRETVRRTLAEAGVTTLYATRLIEGISALGFPLAVYALSRIFLPVCEPEWGLLYLLLGPVFSMAFGLSIGMSAAIVARGRKRSIALAVMLVAATMLYPVIRSIFVPVAFAYGAAFGYFPGPLYDPVIGVKDAYLWSRLITFLLIVLLLALDALAVRKTSPVTRSRKPIGALLAAGLSLPAWAGLLWNGETLGITSSLDAIEQALDAVYTSEHFVIHYPAEGTVADQIRVVAAEHEALYARLAKSLETEPKLPIHSYLYPSEAVKKKLIGAGRTSLAFISGATIHLNYDSFPDRVLPHELAHVMSGPRGVPFLKVSYLIGLTEGLAVSQEQYRDDMSVHQWAASMKEIGKLPRVAQTLTATGFWKQPGGRAYTACGSFVQWLIDTQGGIEPFWKAYPWGDFDGAYGQPVDKLVQKWEQFLGTIPLTPDMVALARHRFSARGVFGTPCARAKQRLVDRANVHYGRGRKRQAAEIYEETAEMLGGDPRLMFSAMRARYDDGQYEEVLELGQKILEVLGESSPPLALRINLEMAAAYYNLGDVDLAARIWQDVAAQGFSDQYVRRGVCLDAAARDPERLEPVIRYLIDAGLVEGLLDLTEAARRAPNHPLVRYLLARRYQSTARQEEAAEGYEAALSSGLSNTHLRREAARGAVICWMLAGRLEKAREAIKELSGMEEALPSDLFFASLMAEEVEVLGRPIDPSPQK